MGGDVISEHGHEMVVTYDGGACGKGEEIGLEGDVCKSKKGTGAVG